MRSKQATFFISNLLIVMLALSACQPLPSAPNTADAYPPPDSAATEAAKPATGISPYPGPGDPTVTPIVSLTPIPRIFPCEFTGEETASPAIFNANKIRLSKLEVVLTAPSAFAIVSRIPNTSRLLVTQSSLDHELIKVFDVKTMETFDYGEWNGSGIVTYPKPVWLSSINAVGLVDANEENQLELKINFGGENSQTIQTDLASYFISTDPNGQYIFFVSQQNKNRISIYDVINRNVYVSRVDLSEAKLAFSEFEAPNYVTYWREDRQVSILLYQKNRLFFADLFDERICEIILSIGNTPVESLLAAEWSPNGQYLAVIASPSDGIAKTSEIFVVNMQTGKVKLIDVPMGQIYSGTWSPDGQKLLIMVAKNSRPDDTGFFVFDFVNELLVPVLEEEYLPFTRTYGSVWSPQSDSVFFTCPKVDATGLITQGQICLSKLEVLP